MDEFPPSAAGHGNPVAAVTLALLWVLCGSAHSSPLIQITPDNPATAGSGLVVLSSGWNVLSPLYDNFPGAGLADYAVANLQDSNGGLTGISLAADDTNRFNHYNSNGSLVASPAFPADVKRESFYGNDDDSFNGFARPIATWVFGGFNPNDDLIFTFFASRMDSVSPIDNREGKYEVVGATTVSTTLDARENNTNTASVTVKADAGGNVVLNMTKGPNNNNEFGFFYLTAMTINVNPINSAPVFNVDPIVGGPATQDIAYVGTLDGSATDIDADDVLSYSKISGPAWLSIASDGTLSGTPGNSDVGPNSFTVRVTDLAETFAEATLTIEVDDVFHAWMAGYGLTGEPSDDSDGGGLNNLIEFLFGYDPTDPADDLLFRLELVPSDGTIEVTYPELKPVGDYHLSMAADPALLADPANRVETITKAQIETMSEVQRISRTYTKPQGVGPEFFRLEFVPPPME